MTMAGKRAWLHAPALAGLAALAASTAAAQGAGDANAWAAGAQARAATLVEAWRAAVLAEYLAELEAVRDAFLDKRLALEACRARIRAEVEESPPARGDDPFANLTREERQALAPCVRGALELASRRLGSAPRQPTGARGPGSSPPRSARGSASRPRGVPPSRASPPARGPEEASPCPLDPRGRGRARAPGLAAALGAAGPCLTQEAPILEAGDLDTSVPEPNTSHLILEDLAAEEREADADAASAEASPGPSGAGPAGPQDLKPTPAPALGFLLAGLALAAWLAARRP